jgi:hypothetical protein
MRLIRTLVKLAIVALLVNATYQLFNVYWAHYKFSDGVESATQFRGSKTDDQVRERILELASQLDVPVTDENLTIRTDAQHTIVDSTYVRPVELVPGFTYPWPFTVHTDTVIVRPPSEGLAPPK